MREHPVTIAARDGYALGALHNEPTGTPQAALLINSATGVPKEFYRRFAQYAAEQGYVVLRYDYRGIGGSRPATLRGFQANMRDWGQLDMPAALDWLHQRYAGLRLVALGHSVGGQLLGLMPNHQLLDAAALVAVSTGNPRGMPWAYGTYARVMLQFAFPALINACGYLPASWLRAGEDLPGGVAREWAAWCLNPRYLAADFGRTITQHFYDQFRTPLLWLSLSDDPITTRQTVPAMQRFYRATQIEDRWITPQQLGLPAVGHMGFFREPGRARLWPDVLGWLASEQKTGRAGERESGRVGEWESGRAGERESGRAGERESGRVGERERNVAP